MMSPFIVSQASMLIGCAKSALDEKTPVTVVTIDGPKQASPSQVQTAVPVASQKNTDSRQNVTAAPMGGAKQPDNYNQTAAPGVYSNYTMP